MKERRGIGPSLLYLLLAISIVACSVQGTPSTPIPEEKQLLTQFISDKSSFNLPVNGELVEFQIIPQNEEQTQNYRVDAVELGSQMLITIDDLSGNYLTESKIITPEMDYVPFFQKKSLDSPLAVSSARNVIIEPLLESVKGQTSVQDFDKFMRNNYLGEEIIIVSAINTGYDENTKLTIFESPIDNLIVVIPEEYFALRPNLIKGGNYLAAPNRELIILFVVLLVVATVGSMSIPLFDLLHAKSTEHNVADFIGMPISEIYYLQQKSSNQAMGKTGGSGSFGEGAIAKLFISRWGEEVYGYIDTAKITFHKCEKASDVGLVIDQEPKPGVAFVPIEQDLNLIVCNSLEGETVGHWYAIENTFTPLPPTEVAPTQTPIPPQPTAITVMDTDPEEIMRLAEGVHLYDRTCESFDTPFSEKSMGCPEGEQRYEISVSYANAEVIMRSKPDLWEVEEEHFPIISRNIFGYLDLDFYNLKRSDIYQFTSEGFIKTLLLNGEMVSRDQFTRVSENKLVGQNDFIEENKETHLFNLECEVINECGGGVCYYCGSTGSLFSSINYETNFVFPEAGWEEIGEHQYEYYEDTSKRVVYTFYEWGHVEDYYINDVHALRFTKTILD